MHAVWAAWLRSAVAFNNWVFICSPDTLSRRRWQGIIFDWRLSELRTSDSWLFLLPTLQHREWPLAEMISHHENDLLPPILTLSPPRLFACLPLLPIRALTSFCPHPPLAPLLNSSQSHRWDRWKIIQILLQCEHVEAWPRSGYSQFVNRRLNWDAYRLVGKNFLLSDIDWKPYEFWPRISGKPTAKIYSSFGKKFSWSNYWLTLSKLGGVICVQSGWEIVVLCSLPSQQYLSKPQIRSDMKPWYHLGYCVAHSHCVTECHFVPWGPQSNGAYVHKGTCKGQCKTGRSVWCTTVPK